MVAEKLVELDQAGAPLLQPGGQSLVQVGPLGLRRRFVGRVADQQVAEAKRVVAGDLGRVGSDRAPAHEGGQPRRQSRLPGGQRLHGAAVEDLALHGAVLQDRPLRGIELVEARGEQRLQRGRHDHLAVARLLHHRRHLLDEERIAARRRQDPLACRRLELPLAGRASSSRPASSWRAARAGPLPPQPAPPVEQLGPRHAHQQDRGAGRDEGDVLDEIQERLLAPLDVIEYRDQRPLGGDRLEQLAKRPGDLVGRRDALAAEQGGERLAGAASSSSPARRDSSCLSTSTTGQ